MSFLVLVQGYALVVTPLVSLTQGVAVASSVALATAAVAYVFEHRIAAWGARRAN